jgi:hypothetical protein
LKKAGSILGYKHSEENLAKMRVAKKGENNPMFGKKNSASQPNSIKIEVTDLYLNSKTTYNSVREAARALNIDRKTISNYFKNNQIKPYKKRYVFTKI